MVSYETHGVITFACGSEATKAGRFEESLLCVRHQRDQFEKKLVDAVRFHTDEHKDRVRLEAEVERLEEAAYVTVEDPRYPTSGRRMSSAELHGLLIAKTVECDRYQTTLEHLKNDVNEAILQGHFNVYARNWIRGFKRRILEALNPECGTEEVGHE